MMDLMEAKEVAVEAAMEAGAMLRLGVDENKQISRKSSAVDLLTEYDQRAEAIIVSRIKALFPDHGLVAEENDWNEERTDPDGYIWYIDPLDGTNNYSHGFPVFAVSIALFKGKDPLVGVVYDPMRGECFQAVKGLGASLSTTSTSRSLRVSQRDQLVDSLLATGFPYDRHYSDHDNTEQFRIFLKKALGVRRAGSASLDLAYVAAGRLDGYWEFKLNSWDVAAGVLLVQEAGGRISTITGDDLQISPILAMIASNGLIHDSMIQALSNGVVQA